MAPPEKKQKTDEADGEDVEMKEEAAAAEPKEEEKPELEKDAKAVKGEALKDEITFLAADTTLNVLPSTRNGLLMALAEGGMQHFIAGARANVGITKGRYLFEVKVVEIVGQAVLRVGFSTAGSSLVLGSDKSSIGFDAEGATLVDGKRLVNKQRITRDSIIGVLLNLDSSSPNKNTISLFKDGKRATQPVELPEELHGKALFPHISFRSTTVFVNFGPAVLAPLPFKCHSIQEAAKSDCTVVTHSDKFEVAFPVSLPDEGGFDWLDMYLEKNPHLTELSDRMILDWAEKSGLAGRSSKRSNDKSECLHGFVDERALRTAVYTMAPLQPRSFIIMEVRGNLLEDERKELLDKFDSDIFKKVAMVVMGDPPKDFKAKTQQMTLARKQAASDVQFRAKKAEEKRKKLATQKQKELEKQRKKAIKEAKKRAKELQKKAAAEKKAREAAAAAAAAGEAKEGEAAKEKEAEKEEKEEDKSEEEPESEVEAEEPEEMEVEEDPPKVELDADEKKCVFFQRMIKDLTPAALSNSFSKYTLPVKSEGFAEVQYIWNKEGICSKYLKDWIMDKKLNLRVEELQPGAWANKSMGDWLRTFKEWQGRTRQYEDKVNAKLRAKAQKAAQKARDAALKAAKEKAEAEKKEKEAAAKAAREAAGEPEPEKKEEETKAEEEPKKEETKAEVKEEEDKKESEAEDEEEEPFDFDDLDIYGADDILDVGSGIPLFKEFKAVDWAMMSLRFELHLLAHAFKKDVDDADRLGIMVDHVPFYYQKYFRKTLNPRDYGVETCTELVKLVADTAYLAPHSVLASQLSEEMETFAVFAKITEDARRVRNLHIDLGEESAVLNLNPGILSGQGGKAGGMKGCGMKGKGKDKGFDKGVAPAGWTNPQQWENDLQASWGNWSSKGGKGPQMGKPGKGFEMGGKGGFGKGFGKSFDMGAKGGAGPAAIAQKPNVGLKRPGEAPSAGAPSATMPPPAAPTPQLVSPPASMQAKGSFGGKDAGKGAPAWGGGGKDWNAGKGGKDSWGGGKDSWAGGGGGKDWSKGGGKDWSKGGGKDWSGGKSGGKDWGKGGGKDKGWGGGGKSWGKGGGKW